MGRWGSKMGSLSTGFREMITGAAVADEEEDEAWC